MLGVRGKYISKELGVSLVCLLVHYMLRTKYLIDGNLKKYDILLFCLGNQTNFVDKGGPSYRSKCTWISFLVTEKPTS